MYDILNGVTLIDLKRAVNDSGGEPLGAPFKDHAANRWCQAIITRALPAAEVRLREPAPAKKR